MPKHILYETGDKDAPNAIKDRSGEVVPVSWSCL